MPVALVGALLAGSMAKVFVFFPHLSNKQEKKEEVVSGSKKERERGGRHLAGQGIGSSLQLPNDGDAQCKARALAVHVGGVKELGSSIFLFGCSEWCCLMAQAASDSGQLEEQERRGAERYDGSYDGNGGGHKGGDHADTRGRQSNALELLPWIALECHSAWSDTPLSGPGHGQKGGLSVGKFMQYIMNHEPLLPRLFLQRNSGNLNGRVT